VSIVKQRRWIWKKRKKWNAHRIIKKVFFKKRRWVHLRLKRGYFYALALKKFLRVDLWFKCHANWTYRMFVDSFYRLLVRYLINIRYIANVFRARAMIREKLLQINNKFPKSYSLNDYDLVSFSRTYWFRNRILWSLWRKWLFKKKKAKYKYYKKHIQNKNIIYNKKKCYFIVVPNAKQYSRTHYQKKVEKGITAFYSYRLLTNNRF